jgi:hypothetical protein
VGEMFEGNEKDYMFDTGIRVFLRFSDRAAGTTTFVAI